MALGSEKQWRNFQASVVRPVNRVAKIIATIVCALAKIGLGKQLCAEFKASRILGLSSGFYERGEYEKAFEVLAPYSEIENDHRYGSLNYQLALLYFHGRGVTLNRAMANRLFAEAAELGNTEAQQYLSQFDGPYRTRT